MKNNDNSKKVDISKLKWKRVKTPTMFQMEASECGAAALGMVLSYYGKHVSLTELRQECGVSRDGSKASNMVKAARRYGFTAKGYKKEDIEDLKTLTFPMILFWNFNHFVVFEGVKGKKFYINDPASGPRVLLRDDFDIAFSGVVLDFKPNSEFKKSGRKPSIIPSLSRRLSSSKLALIYIFLVTLFLVIPGLVLPACSRVFVDYYLIKRMDSWVKPLLIAMALTAFFRTILTWLQTHYLLLFETKLAIINSSQFFWHVLRLPVEFFNQRFGGEIGSRVAINDQVASLLSGQLTSNFVGAIMIIFYAIIMFQYDTLLTLIVIISAILQIYMLKLVSKKMVDKSQKLQIETGKLTGISMGGLGSIETLKACGGESDFFEKWAGYFTKLTNSSHDLSVFSTFLGIFPGLLSNLANMAVLGIGGLRVMDGHLTIGMLVAFQTLTSSFMSPVMELVGLGTQIQQLEGGMNRLDDVLNNRIDPFCEEKESEENEKLREANFYNKLSGKIELKNVTFGYNRLAPPLIRDFNLTIEPGERIALVGKSGCGKSTIARLICGLYEPWSGEILFDGKPRIEIDRMIITNSLAMVNQEIFLFEDSIKNNLTLWDSTIDEENIIRAAKDASIHEDITLKPGGYESIVAEGGTNFSGGQRQRLEIARSLVNSPTILVLDEATSALDPYTEAKIDKNLRRRGCTCVIAAHRLSTIRDCDEIIVLENGIIVQRGTHDNMKNIEGTYARLISHE